MALKNVGTLPRWLTTKDVSELTAMHKQTVQKLCASGELKSVRVGRTYRIRAEDIEEYMNSLG
ncbi:helix-turn-helix domain-containing protein [Corynebacterium pseudodiphtheriticum]|uniref:helix-turn-helix domain-containing protein n=1 Tax=Corynebacterium pseudodiphtheriticum TaxID=37637 RepID=UPI00234C70A6|nr:helix-turn-helix domain-containing protein [Corynebacterium pseudodiphtheriticum]MDC7087813.1 helix-turn-helix domain-containing protein [Corynebacterium pseudodiphtheriticum]